MCVLLKFVRISLFESCEGLLLFDAMRKSLFVCLVLVMTLYVMLRVSVKC